MVAIVVEILWWNLDSGITSTMAWTAWRGADRSGGAELGGAAAVAEETGTVATTQGTPARFIRRGGAAQPGGADGSVGRSSDGRQRRRA